MKFRRRISNRRIKTGTSGDEWFYLGETLNGLLNRFTGKFRGATAVHLNASLWCRPPSVSNQLEVSLQRNRDAEGIQERDAFYFQQDVLIRQTHANPAGGCQSGRGSAGGLEIEPVPRRVILQVVNKNAQRWMAAIR